MSLYMPLFTSATAAEMGRKGALARAEREQALRLAVDLAVSSPQVDFAGRTLARVRLQMENISDEIDKCISRDSKRLKELTESYSRLAAQEAMLAGRELPGRRPPQKAARVRVPMDGQ